MNIMRRTLRTLAIALAALLCRPALAQLHAGDIILWSADDKVITGGSSGGSFYAPARIFMSTFGAQGVPNFTTNPGFNTVPNLFPASQPVGITIRTAARKWNGANFCTIPAETLTLYRSAASISTPAADPAPGTEPNLAIGITASGTGFIHTHPTWGIDAPYADGVYLVELEAWATSATNIAPAHSDPFWIILNQNALQPEVDAAAAWLADRVSTANPLCPPTAPPCVADFNNINGVTIDDLFLFFNAYFNGDPSANVNGVASVTIDDLFFFINAWFTGCP